MASGDDQEGVKRTFYVRWANGESSTIHCERFILDTEGASFIKTTKFEMMFLPHSSYMFIGEKYDEVV